MTYLRRNDINRFNRRCKGSCRKFLNSETHLNNDGYCYQCAKQKQLNGKTENVSL